MKQLAKLGSELKARLEPIRARVARSWAWAKPRARTALQRTKAFTKRTFIGVLMSFEKMLLTHKGRERTQATATFVLIFAFAVTSVDFLLTGGPEFGEGARAATYATHVDLIAPRSAHAAPIETADAAQLTASEAPEIEEIAAPAAAATAPEVREISALAGIEEPAPKAEPEPTGVALPPKQKV